MVERAALGEGVGAVGLAVRVDGDVIVVAADVDGAAALLRRALPAHPPAEQAFHQRRRPFWIADRDIDMLDARDCHDFRSCRGGGSPRFCDSYNLKLS